jgi:hypothetical protein
MSTELDFSGWDLDLVYQQGQGRDLFVAFGCSWTRAWGSYPKETMVGLPGYVENTEFLSTKSYMALIADHLDIERRFNFAQCGSNNDTQARLIIEFVQKNRSRFNRVFLLWGITSIYRWELYCNRIDAPWSYMRGSHVPRDEQAELEHYFKHHWEKSYQLDRLADRIVTLSAYLESQQVEHCFFPVFQAYNQHNLALPNLPKQLFRQEKHTNDMMGLMCENESLDAIDDFLSDANNRDTRINDLIQAGYLSQHHAHPTEKGHRFIADNIIEWLSQQQ